MCSSQWGDATRMCDDGEPCPRPRLADLRRSATFKALLRGACAGDVAAVRAALDAKPRLREHRDALHVAMYGAVWHGRAGVVQALWLMLQELPEPPADSLMLECGVLAEMLMLDAYDCDHSMPHAPPQQLWHLCDERPRVSVRDAFDILSTLTCPCHAREVALEARDCGGGRDEDEDEEAVVGGDELDALLAELPPDCRCGAPYSDCSDDGEGEASCCASGVGPV